MSCPYKSLVFLDLESTDLPQCRPAITELSFVALSSDHFENCSPGTETLARVLHKLTICVNPLKKIVPEAVIITGLDNFLLQDESVFNGKKARLLSTFLENLQQPICLIAHNGNGFDFPLLAKSLNECSAMIDVHCVDSLPIFRKIEEDAKKFDIFLDSELEELKQQEEPLARTDSMAETSISALDSERSASPDLFGDTEDDDMLSQITEQAEHKFMSTPVTKKICSDIPPKVPSKQPTRRIDRSKMKPRQLFKPSYKLTSIFERFFGYAPPKAHRAEEDTLTLLKCAQFYARDFLMNIPHTGRSLQSFVKGKQ